MTTPHQYVLIEHLQHCAATYGFLVRTSPDCIVLTPQPALWPGLAESPIGSFASCEEALAWIEGVAWAQFVERAKGGAK